MADVKITPLGKRILVKPEEVEEKTSGGLYIPESANEDKKPAFGTVVKASLKKSEIYPIKVGDKVFFDKYSPKEIEVNGTKYLIVDVEDVLAVIA